MMSAKKVILLPSLVISAIVFSFPFLSSTWEKHNPFYGKWERDIYYYNASDYNRSLLYAFQKWEDTGIPLRFLPAESRESADLVIFSDLDLLKKKCKSCVGFASIGDNLFGQSRIDLMPPMNPLEDEVMDFIMLPTIIHEIGHTLGLSHNDKPCSIMNSNSACNRVARARFTDRGREMMCGPWEEDLEDLRELYEGIEDSVSGWCHDLKYTRDYFSSNAEKILGHIEKRQYLEKIYTTLSERQN